MGYQLNSVVRQPYDTKLEENISMYDKLPYQRNIDLCNASTLALNSGNLVKYYRCANAPEAKEIDTRDNRFSSIVSEHLKEQEEAYRRLHTQYPTLYGALPDNMEFEEDYESDETIPEDMELTNGDEE